MRRWLHPAITYGFLSCFASTAQATLYYFFASPAPYDFFTLPKLLGAPGGILLTLGCLGMAWPKLTADPALGAARVLEEAKLGFGPVWSDRRNRISAICKDRYARSFDHAAPSSGNCADALFASALHKNDPRAQSTGDPDG